MHFEATAVTCHKARKHFASDTTYSSIGYNHDHQRGHHALALLFIPQQQRLLNTAPEHANVILALNNSALYLGIAGGAAIGGLALRFFVVTQLAWVGAISILIALLIVNLSQIEQG